MNPNNGSGKTLLKQSNYTRYYSRNCSKTDCVAYSVLHALALKDIVAYDLLVRSSGRMDYVTLANEYLDHIQIKTKRFSNKMELKEVEDLCRTLGIDTVTLGDKTSAADIAAA